MKSVADHCGCGSYCCVVILDPANPIQGINGLEKIDREKNAMRFYDEIKKKKHYVGLLDVLSLEEIDKLEYSLGQTMKAMERAVAGLSITPDMVLVDGNRCPNLPMASQAVIKGDSLVQEISAASILAKVTRDRKWNS